jgi:amino acid transporter
VFAFKIDTFNLDFWGNPKLGSIVDQVKSTMLVTVWVFIGIEGASMFSGRAEKMSDVGKATVVGFLLTIALLVAVSVLALGVMTQPELAALKNPSTAYVLEKAIGPWGANIMNAGLVISVGGALLAWTLLAAEAPYLAGKDGVMPRIRYHQCQRFPGSIAVADQRSDPAVPDHHPVQLGRLPGTAVAGHLDDPDSLPAVCRVFLHGGSAWRWLPGW